MQIVVLAPHGDDEVLGFGGTISKHIRNGDKVCVFFFKKPYSKRTFQQKLDTTKSAQILGFECKYLDIPQAHLSTFVVNIVQQLEKELSALSPDVLYIPHPGDTHQDHHMVYRYTKIATRINGPAPIRKILCGEIISSTGCSIDLQKFNPQYYNEIDEQDLTLKKQALQCYTQEINSYPHPRSLEGMEIHARKRGMEAGVLFAEAFECLRHIN